MYSYHALASPCSPRALLGSADSGVSMGVILQDQVRRPASSTAQGTRLRLRLRSRTGLAARFLGV